MNPAFNLILLSAFCALSMVRTDEEAIYSIRADRSVQKRADKHLLTGHIKPVNRVAQAAFTTPATFLPAFDLPDEDTIDESSSFEGDSEASNEDSGKALTAVAQEYENDERDTRRSKKDDSSNEFYRYMEDHLPAVQQKRHSNSLSARFKRWAARFARAAAAVGEQPEREDGASVPTYEEFFARHRV